MLTSVDYLAAVAEDTWFEEEGAAQRVADRIGRLEEHYQPHTAIENARELLRLLQRVQMREAKVAETLIENSAFRELTTIEEAEAAIRRLERSLTAPPWRSVAERYPKGSNCEGTIVNVREFGVFVEVEPGVTGLIHASRLPKEFESMEEFDIGERIQIEVVSIDPLRQRMEMAHIAPAPEGSI